MKSIALILINQKKAFENIGSDFSDELHRKSVYIFSTYGLVNFFFNFSLEDNQEGFFLNFMGLILGISISIITFMFLSYLLYWIGKRLNGIAEDMDIESIVAHSLVPIIVGLLIVMIMKKTVLIESSWNNPYLRNGILWLSWFLSIKILIQGSIRFNNFSYGKSLLTISPIILINIGFLIVYQLIK